MKTVALSLSLVLATHAHADDKPPTFAGATGAAAAGPTSVTVRWNAAQDDVTPEKAIRYFVCRGATPKDCAKTFRPVAVVTGATEATITGLPAKAKLHFSVRAEDASGNRDANKATVTATTPADSAGPKEVANLKATDVTPGATILTWDAAEDDATAALALVYEVCWGTGASECETFKAMRTTQMGSTRAGLAGLVPRTTYHVAVRARDEAGNVGGAARVTFSTPADKKAPRFAGAKTTKASGGGTIQYEWDPAEDDVTPATGIVYEVCASPKAGGCKVSFAPKVTTPPGATRAEVGGLAAGKTYSVAVRAVDAGGNKSDIVERTVVMPADTAPPKFAGVTKVTASADNSLLIEWAPATDDLARPEEIVYGVCWAPSKDTCMVAFNATVSSLPGQTWVKLSGLNPKTTYHVLVRAKDTAGNLDANRVQKSVTTP